ncbi:MAG TPA: polysaccharide deacetylase family protein, partial [Candidatus Polarisedimenticolaceae bacterium]|nr:polysaccharide deacetylase family protein [Candidatus Polarisedimenticolaceae bacterium]
MGDSLNGALKSRTFAGDRRTWLATLAIGAVAWAGTSAWLNRRVAYAARKPAAEASDGRFVVLAYDRIVATPDGRSIDRTALREQLLALAGEGWQPVTLAELADAYGGRGRLPQRPVLLTFDEGYLTTYEAADPVLRELRWPAVMFLRTDRQEKRDVSFLFWDRLRRMAQSGLWEIASGDPAAGRAAGGRIPREPPGFALIAERLD